jgi:hypothetical protein
MAFTFGPRTDGRTHVVVGLEADLGQIANLGGEDRPATALSLSMAVTHRDSGEVRRTDEQVRIDSGQGGPALEGWLHLRREFELRPGVAQARIVLRDEFLGRTGALCLRFEVPEPRGLRLSTPILSDRAVARLGEGLRPVFLARREFGPRGVLYAQFDIYGVRSSAGVAPGVTTSFELRRADGVRVQAGGPETLTPAAQGRLVRLITLPLDGLTHGSYELVLRAEDPASGVTAERIEAFRLR